MKDSLDQFTKTSIFLHWFVGITMIISIAVGIYMHEEKVRWLNPIHKSVGTIIIVFAVWRIVRRIRLGFPPPLGQVTKIEMRAARFNQSLMLICTFLIPLFGIIMSIASGRGLYVFGMTLYASTPDPDREGKFIAISKAVSHFSKDAHSLIAWFLIFLISIHVVAAFKHHYFYKYSTIKRMLGKKIKPVQE